MAALAAPISSSWIPEDDLLLKNAIEAGASLEALAKGAVRFSRKFTVKELQDRWRSLLYDPVISAEASARMFEAEQSGNNPLSKSHKNVTYLDNAQTPGKRNFDSIRRMYYSMRKRICTAPRNSSSISFIDSVNANDCVDSGDGYQEGTELHDENPTEGYALQGYIQNHFGFQENIQHHGPHDILEGNPMNDCFNEFPEKEQPSSMKEAVMIESLQHDNARESSMHVVAEPVVDFGKGSGVEEIAPCHAFPDSHASFNLVGYSSPQPRACPWKTMEDVPAPVMPINDCSGENKGLDSGERVMHIDDMDDKRISSSECNVVNSEHMLKSRHSSLEMNGSTTASRGDFGDLSDGLLNFAEENENIFLDTVGGDTLDKSCYDPINSLLVSSPNDVHENDMPNAKERKTLVSDTCHGMPNDECLAEFEIFLVNQSHSAHKKERGISCSEANVPPLKSVADISSPEANVPTSTSLPGPHSPELHHKVIYCTLSTEDPEIPCNDHVFFGKASAMPASQISCQETSDQASTFANKKTSKGELSRMKSEDNVTQAFTAPKLGRLDTFSETIRRVKVESHDAEYHAMSGQANNALTEPGQLGSSHAFASTAADDGIKEDPSRACNGKDMQMLAETIGTALVPAENPSTSDLEQYESNDDVPCFSDIEAMVLGMDLCPEDSDLCISREVARYQPEGAKRTILRLEQCAHASLQRAVASQGAFAVFYGRRLKHYIRKTEVMLGRATEDVGVDIDLGREGRANKISRRQALIKMEEDGSFHLRNLGKNSMFINGKEVSTRQRIGLSSSSLIEIREMAFVFEINHKSVRRYLANMSEKNLGKNSKFEWKDEQVTGTVMPLRDQNLKADGTARCCNGNYGEHI
ncbi:hypothetical protein SLEP1_g49044 [Rubroshorea leprosula]|uniref:FHA domain-containing protein n=1 Tax=Rubroshorea leprosula TaxID=152421 RepID=A0AAV5LYH7_9ROSI|nr:hypothetical protein SLEP1_g49044 [Rubroshorea leprosula]